MSVNVSIIIPTLNEAVSIRKTLAAIKGLIEMNSHLAEIIVVDGGSHDETISIVEEDKILVLKAPRGRGAQMHAGAKISKGDILWFLHADTVPPEDALEKIVDALIDKGAVGGNFTIHFEGQGIPARFLTWLYPQLRKIGLCYGDSAIFVRRDVYEKIGGFQAFPIFEDLDLITRLKKEGKVINLTEKVITSSRRFENRNFFVVFTKWMFLQSLYWLGVNPHVLNKFYLPVRTQKR
jgi:rSAM/selenodomain-associated transferase 2